MFSQSSTFHTPDNTNDRIRQQLNHATSQSSLHGTHHPQSSTLSNSLNDPFLQSRSNYQSGYLMSMSQNNASPPTHQRFDDMPLVQTKAKLNSTLSRPPTSEFGKDPMFESSRQRQTSDEDAPPIASVNDMLNVTYSGSPSYLQRSNSNFDSSMTQAPQATPHQAAEPLYVIVFGYPPDKYSVAVEYFKQLGDTTDPDPNTEISNCFKIGFKNPAEAMWAVRKNGEIIGGSWMVGVKWADFSQADRVLGQAAARTPYPLVSDVSSPSDIVPTDSTGLSRSSHQLSLPTARSPHHNTPTVGTPIRLAPSASAFRKPGQTPRTATSTPGPQPTAFPTAVGTPGTPSKSMLGQFSDLVFGW
ncbi:hypothetical protein V8E52_003740 [Russula decolorans]